MGRRSNADQRREEIIRALFECLADGGHEKVTIKQIATRAALPHGVIHYYFEKKDDIVAALGTSITETYARLVEETLAPLTNPAERMDRMLDLLVDAFVFDRRLNRVFYNLVQMGFERQGVRTPLRRMLTAYRETLEILLRDAGAGDKSTPLACLLVAIVEGLALQWMIDPDVLSKDHVRQIIKRTVRHQLTL
jgi:AcrR family transcriptional regulator